MAMNKVGETGGFTIDGSDQKGQRAAHFANAIFNPIPTKASSV